MDNSWGYSDNGGGGGYGNGRSYGGGGGGRSWGGDDRGGARQWDNNGGGRGGGMGGGDVVTMQVDRSHVGRIIGKRGAKIQELEGNSGARIKVLNSDDPGAAEATIEIRGSRDTIQIAQDLINDLVNSSYDNRGGGGGGYGGGRGGGGYGGGGGFGGGRGGGGGGWGGPQAGDETTTIHVGNENLGRIIGKGGSKIKELQMMSGCRINVMSKESGPTETPIELTGNPSATREAEKMIQDLISAY